MGEINQEMIEWFEERTRKHILLVQKYGERIVFVKPSGVDMIHFQQSLSAHDNSKYGELERTPYIHISWQYHMKDLGIVYEIPEGIDGSAATLHHITTNPHHPEYHQKERADILNRENRDAIPSKAIDATSMPFEDICEMVADWCAMSEERNNSPKMWADFVIGKRWIFDDKQRGFIYSLINKIWFESKPKGEA